MTLMTENGMNSADKYPFAHTRSAQYISKQIDALAGERTQREIAMSVGWNQPAVLSMVKRGEVKLPLDKAVPLARALRVNEAYLLRMVLEDYYPPLAEALFKQSIIAITENEIDLIRTVREITGNSDPALSEEGKEKLKGVFA